MSGSNPVPQPPTEPSGAARAASKPKWLVPVIAGGCAVVLAAGGTGGYLWWNHSRLTEASGECSVAYEKAVKARKKLTEYLKSDALKAAVTVKDSEVRDAKTVGTLASTVKTASNTKADLPGCPADGLKDIKAVTARLDKTSDVYAKTVGEVKAEAEAVNASKTDKIVADATKVLDDSKGRVKDDKVRAALENAVKSKDGKAISDAVKAVNDSIKAKSDADANAEAEKAKQAADNAAQAPDNGSSYTGDTTGGYTGYTGGGYTQSQGGYAYMPQQPTGNGGGYTPAPQPTPQPQPQQPSQGGGNGGSSGGDDGYYEYCWVGDTSGKPGVQVPCN